jgi:pyridoxine 4-dehydrogenase
MIGDRRVLRLGLGAMRLGPRNVGDNRSEPLTVLRRAIDVGVNLIDTADACGPGISERLIAEALHPYPDDLVIATRAAGPARVPTNGARTVAR